MANRLQELIFLSKEKIAIAKQLEKWGISAIEAGFPAASPDSFTAVQEIAKVLTKTAVTGLARSVKSDIDACYEALKDAKYPQNSRLYRNQSHSPGV